MISGIIISGDKKISLAKGQFRLQIIARD